jgi:hypothetical protein
VKQINLFSHLHNNEIKINERAVELGSQKEDYRKEEKEGIEIKDTDEM